MKLNEMKGKVMEHHKLVQFTMAIFMIFISITVSPVISLFSIYFYLIGWYTNEKELAKLNTVITNFQKIKSSKEVYILGLVNIGLQFFMALFSGFMWAVVVITMFTIPFFLGIASTEET